MTSEELKWETYVERRSGAEYHLKRRMTSIGCDMVYLHRDTGPAFVGPGGHREWWLEGVRYTFENYVNKLFPKDSPQRTLFLLKWNGP